MNIIKHGNQRMTLMHFKCQYCGCEFEMNIGQRPVKSNSQIDIVLGCAPYYTKCPECPNYADGDYVSRNE